jgi:hypothetical protein
MRRFLGSIPVVTAVLWLAIGVWAYALEKEPTSLLFGKHWLPVSKEAAAQACR